MTDAETHELAQVFLTAPDEQSPHGASGALAGAEAIAFISISSQPCALALACAGDAIPGMSVLPD